MKINDIQNIKELAIFLHFPISKMKKILYSDGTDKHYSEIEIPKKSGGVRKINIPSKDLGELQKKILCILENYIKENDIVFSHASQAYQKDSYQKNKKNFINLENGDSKGIYSNAKKHRSKKLLLNIDLDDFFPTIHFGRIVGFFENNNKFRFNHKLSVLLANIMCYKGRLPQGACTSPIMSNLICHILDIHILKISKKYKLVYTRYADDLSFSTNNYKFADEVIDFVDVLNKQINADGFKINWKKLNFSGPDERHTVTGLVNNYTVGVKKEYYKNTRAMVQSVFYNNYFFIDGVKFGIENLDCLEGRLAFIDDIDKRNNKKKNNNNVKDFKNLSSREKTYSKFIFFRYFWQNIKPMIICEGKTDPIYLSSAIKANKNIIDKKITFFNRNDKRNYFLGIKKNGADTMTAFINSYLAKGKNNSLPKCFQDKQIDVPSNPIIFLFDHELEPKSEGVRSPIMKLISAISSSGEKGKKETINLLKEKGYKHLINNVYIAIVMKEDIESDVNYEIEDLFPDKVLENVFGHGIFETKASDDTPSNKIISKDDFSKIIRKKNDDIFYGFKPTLKVIQNIIDDYENNKEKRFKAK